MKKLLSIFLAALLCLSLSSVAFAAEEFTPSVSYKGHPELVIIHDEDGNPHIGIVRDEKKDILSYVDKPCLVITPVSKANTSTEIPDAARELLLNVYEQLTKGDMELPYEKFGSQIKAEDMVIRDLFDATWLCGNHPVELEPEGVVLELTFDLGVEAGTPVYTMTYNDGEWNPIISTVNNGDGTVTCTFEHLCPIAFSVSTADVDTPQTGDAIGDSLYIWVALLVVSGAALVALIVFGRKSARK